MNAKFNLILSSYVTYPLTGFGQVKFITIGLDIAMKIDFKKVRKD